MKLDRSSKQLAGYMWRPVDATTTYGNQVEDARHDDQLQPLGSPSRQDPELLFRVSYLALSLALSCAGFGLWICTPHRFLRLVKRTSKPNTC
jgi:hypothetical protein